jgi:hypothetical protein
MHCVVQSTVANRVNVTKDEWTCRAKSSRVLSLLEVLENQEIPTQSSSVLPELLHYYEQKYVIIYCYVAREILNLQLHVDYSPMEAGHV